MSKQIELQKAQAGELIDFLCRVDILDPAVILSVWVAMVEAGGASSEDMRDMAEEMIRFAEETTFDKYPKDK